MTTPCSTKQSLSSFHLHIFRARMCLCFISTAVQANNVQNLPPNKWKHWGFNKASLLYVCIPTAALQIGSSAPSSYIPYTCMDIRYLFSWLTSLRITGSRFIHLIRTDCAFFFRTNIPWYLCTTTLFIHLSMDMEDASMPLGLSIANIYGI